MRELDFIFVHGAWHSPFCWHKVMPILELAGYRYLAVNLPLEEGNFNSYADQVLLALKNQTKPVTLVGHSMGASVVTKACDLLPASKIKAVVYIAGLLPRNGESITQVLDRLKDESLLSQNLVFSDNYNYFQVNDNCITEVFYNDCDVGEIKIYKANLRKQKLKPMQEVIYYDEHKLNKIPKTYIECLKDNAINVSVQRKMAQHLQGTKIISMDSGHSPFYSKPEELAQYFLAAAKLYCVHT